jgi:hypothetical protein
MIIESRNCLSRQINWALGAEFTTALAVIGLLVAYLLQH